MRKDEISRLVEKQRAYFKSGISQDLDFRIEQLEKLRKLIDDNENSILDALKFDLGKSRTEGYMSEVGFVNSEIKYMLKNLRKFARPEKVKTPLVYLGALSYIIPQALGVVLIVGPWNYPFQLIISPLIGAMAAGNCSVIKPSEHAPRVSALINSLIKENFAEDYIKVIEGGIETSGNILEQKFDHIFFTGSESVGRIVMQAAARNLTPVSLELGGKSPCIVDRDINLLYTARRIVWGKFLNAGQTCVAPDYLLVHTERKKELLETMKEVIRVFYGDEPLDSEDYSRIINDNHFLRLIELMKEGDIISGGQYQREEKYIAPTIMDNISPDHLLMQEEIFGPILPVMEYASLEEVIGFLNKRPKPLALYFFSKDKEKQDRILQETTSGGVCINDTISHITTRELPFGGAGESGMGVYHGKASFDTFSHKKSVLKNTFLFDIPVKYPPYKISLDWLKRLLKGL